MQIWESLRYKNRQSQLSFHFVCCAEFERLLDKIEQEHFADFQGRERAQVVNAILSVMEPFLLRHLNLEGPRWKFSLSGGEGPLQGCKDGEKVVMDREMRVLLDGRVYSLLKKLHEAGDRGFILGRARSGTFSMALVLRAVLIKCFELLDVLGRDGLVRWVRDWLEQYETVEAPANREKWKVLGNHMVALYDKNTKYIALYGETFRQIHLYHPPPGKNIT